MVQLINITVEELQNLIRSIIAEEVSKIKNSNLESSEQTIPGLPQGMISRQEVMRNLKLSNCGMWAAVKRNNIPSFKFGKSVYYNKKDIEGMFKQQEQENESIQ